MITENSDNQLFFKKKKTKKTDNFIDDYEKLWAILVSLIYSKTRYEYSESSGPLKV